MAKWILRGEFDERYLEEIVVEYDRKSGTLLLKINNRPAVNAPQGCILSIQNKIVNGKVLVIVEGDQDRYLDALEVNNRRVITDLTNP